MPLRKKKSSSSPSRMIPGDSSPILGGDLTVNEAKHILGSEGGELTVRELAVQTAFAIALSASLFWAIWSGKATLWHLFLPMLGEFFVYLLALPILYAIVRHRELRHPTRQAVATLAGIAVLLTLGLVVRARYLAVPFTIQFQSDFSKAWNWVSESAVHWAILIACLHMLRNAVQSTLYLVRKGPPFLGPGLGCGMRVAVFALSAAIVPTVGLALSGGSKGPAVSWLPPLNLLTLTWLLWGCLLATDLLLLWFRWDVQQKLKSRGYRLDSPTDR